MKAPTYGAQKVNPQAIAPIRANVNAPVESFGGGKANPIEDVSKVVDAGAKLYQQEKQNADTLASNIYGKKAAQDFHGSQYLPEGAFQSQGLNAMGASEKLHEQYTDLKSKALEKATNDNQRIMIAKYWDDEYAQMQKTMGIHESSQRREVEIGNAKAVTENSQNLAVINYKDRDQLKKSLFDQSKTIYELGRSQGMYQEEINKQIDKVHSDTALGVLQRYVDTGDMLGARNFHNGYKSLLRTDDSIHKAEQLLKEGGKKNEAIQYSNKFVEQYNDAYAAKKAAEEEIKDPETLELTQTMITAKMKEKNEAPLRVYDNRLMQAKESIDKTGDVSPSISAGLLPDGKRAVQQYALWKRGLVTVKPDNSAYLTYSNMSMEELAKVPQSKMLMEVQVSTTPDQFKSIWDRYQIARDGMNGEPGAKAKWNSTGEDHASMLTALKDAGIINDTLSMEGVNKNAKTRKIFINTWNDTAAAIDKEMANRGGKPLSDEERKRIMKDVVNRTVKTVGSIFGTNESRVVEINPDDEDSINKVFVEPVESAQMIQAAKVNGIIPLETTPAQAERMIGVGMRKAKIYATKYGAFDSDEKAKILIDILRGNKK